MSTIVERRRPRSRGFARGRAFAFAIACALQLEIQAMDHFCIDPPMGSVGGGDRVTIHLVTRERAAVEAFHFGKKRVAAEGADPRTFFVKTPPRDEAGEPVIPGVYEAPVTIEFDGGRKIASGASFFYIDKTPRDRAPEIVSLKPSHGHVEGGEHVTIQGPALAAQQECTPVEVLFRGARVEVVSSDASTITVVTPRIETAKVEEVPVQLRCGGRTIGTGTFVYTPASPPPTSGPTESNHAPIAATATVGLVLAAELAWIFKRLQTLMRRPDAPPPPPAANDADDITEPLQRFADKHQRAIDELQRSLLNAVAAVPQQVASLAEKRGEKSGLRETNTPPENPTVKSAGSSPPAATPASSQTRPPKQESSRTVAAKQASTQRSADAEFNPTRLADMWNEVRRSAGSSEELIRSLNGAWPGKVVARAARGLIVVTSADEDATWVLPPMQPLVHEATIQEFFEVRPAGDASSTRVLRPAHVPRGTDLEGFTAGQITRGILEA